MYCAGPGDTEVFFLPSILVEAEKEGMEMGNIIKDCSIINRIVDTRYMDGHLCRMGIRPFWGR